MNFTNKEISTIDWCATERQAMLKKIPKKKKRKDVELFSGQPARGVWMTDVSMMDSRSVKAQLAGRGDHRVMWWNVSSFVLRLFSKDKSLEHAMYRFHQFHHHLTLSNLESKIEAEKLSDRISQRGFLGAFKERYLK
jgi:hypothetical protein